MNREEILRLSDEENARFLRLQFTDLLGVIKNVEVPRSQFEKALDGQILFDGSSIQGFTRIEESDMVLVPDWETFQVNPWTNPDGSRVARMICDVHLPDGTPFAGCPAPGFEAADRTRRCFGLHHGCRAGSRVLPVPERRDRQHPARYPRRRRLLRSDAGRPG